MFMLLDNYMAPQRLMKTEFITLRQTDNSTIILIHSEEITVIAK